MPHRDLGMNSASIPITVIDQLNISWKPDHLRDLNPSPLFETRFAFEYQGERQFKTQSVGFSGTYVQGKD